MSNEQSGRNCRKLQWRKNRGQFSSVNTTIKLAQACLLVNRRTWNKLTTHGIGKSRGFQSDDLTWSIRDIPVSRFIISPTSSYELTNMIHHSTNIRPGKHCLPCDRESMCAHSRQTHQNYLNQFKFSPCSIRWSYESILNVSLSICQGNPLAISEQYYEHINV